METRLDDAIYHHLRSRSELGQVRHALYEAQTALADLCRDLTGTAAAKTEELEAIEVRGLVMVADLVAVGDRFRNERSLSRSQFTALKSELKLVETLRRWSSPQVFHDQAGDDGWPDRDLLDRPLVEYTTSNVTSHVS